MPYFLYRNFFRKKIRIDTDKVVLFKRIDTDKAIKEIWRWIINIIVGSNIEGVKKPVLLINVKTSTLRCKVQNFSNGGGGVCRPLRWDHLYL